MIAAMKRRDFIALLGGAAAAWPCVAAAESAKKRPVIGILAQGTPAQLKGLRFRQSFLDGMQELGYSEGRDFDMVARAAESTGDLDRKSTRLNSSHVAISYAVFCLKKKIDKHYRVSHLYANLIYRAC